ncbi:hypothetical protein SDRG_01923 [Saprolegnia diclina VS20]|uniref:Uncharacterized protein n=1 Tax=Saprolegnia diclina (strain VS20) TaxID=1156394 RepID=T0SD68_SAPDV|nr:hypothetical protein SDRG_01923 [Saprolegnia diclina VS20]EQC40857.1 hypothetical protein SDRG_01923 [Saprolegnia diclina VS20]|eukprot:XP_008605701.1 hypothetical protein SDRG_01923 [Saprolegnia diclina VS20]
MGVWITNGRDEAIEVATVGRASMRQLRDAAQAHFALSTDGRPLVLMANDGTELDLKCAVPAAYASHWATPLQLRPLPDPMIPSVNEHVEGAVQRCVLPKTTRPYTLQLLMSRLLRPIAHCLVIPRVASERALILPTRRMETYGSNDDEPRASIA